MARWPQALWQPVSQVGGTLRPIAVCLHHQAGNGNPAPIYASRNVSAHFWIPRAGTPVQHVDTERQAWHGVAHNAYSIGVETEGCGTAPHADPLTENQINLFAELMRWANDVHGIPLVLSESVDAPGLNYHRCAGGPATGCPCDVRVNARAEILRRAGAIGPPVGKPQPDPTTGVDTDMICTDPETGGLWVVASKEGAVFTYDGAPYVGATNNTEMNAGRYPCVGLDVWLDQQDRAGLVMVLDWGDRGDGKSKDGGDRFRRYRFPRDGSGKAKAGTTY